MYFLIVLSAISSGQNPSHLCMLFRKLRSNSNRIGSFVLFVGMDENLSVQLNEFVKSV